QVGLDLLLEKAEFDRPLAQPPPRHAEPDCERRDQAEQNLDGNERRAAYHPLFSAAPPPQTLARTFVLAQSESDALRKSAVRPTAVRLLARRPAMAKTLKLGDPAPPFDLPTAGGDPAALPTLRAKPVSLY